MADRYTGRHIHEARHIASQQRRSRSNPGMLPTAAALTISGALIGGAGALVQFGTEGESRPEETVARGAMQPDIDRDLLADKASRDGERSIPSGNGAVISSGSCRAVAPDPAGGVAEFTAARESLPVGSVARVTNLANGKSVEVRIVPATGPNTGCIDLSQAAFDAIAEAGAAVVDVRYEVLVADAT